MTYQKKSNNFKNIMNWIKTCYIKDIQFLIDKLFKQTSCLYAVEHCRKITWSYRDCGKLIFNRIFQFTLMWGCLNIMFQTLFPVEKNIFCWTVLSKCIRILRICKLSTTKKRPTASSHQFIQGIVYPSYI